MVLSGFHRLTRLTLDVSGQVPRFTFHIPAAAGAGVVVTRPEEDVLAGGEGFGAERLVELIRFRPGVHSHPAEIVAHVGAYLFLQCALQRLSAAAGAADVPGGGLIRNLATGPPLFSGTFTGQME
jgi:hypothetical protein